MKKLIIALTGLIAFSCNPKEKETLQMQGAYNQVSQTIKGGDLDTTSVTLQLKIYTSDHMMYADFNAGDSTVSFGIGSYSIEAGGVTENVFYSAGDTTANSNLRTYKLEIEKSDAGFKQVIRDMEIDSVKYQLIEVYDRVSTDQSSPLDGAWQLVSYVTISKGDTTKVEISQYKTYAAGNFIFGHAYRDSTKVLHTGIGYGTFEMANNSKSKETVKVSNYKEIAGQTVDIDIALNGPDEYTQTITNQNGNIEIEVYKRLKK